MGVVRREEEEEGGSLMRKREVTADEDVITLWCDVRDVDVSIDVW